MSAWDSVDLLAQFNQRAGRPTSAVGQSDTITDTAKYDRLAKAQDRVVAMIAGVVPKALYPKGAYGSFPQMITTDNQVFRFGSDTLGNPMTPMGVSIYASLNDIPDYPWQADVDYLDEVSQIRIPQNRTFAGPLFWRGIIPPAPISGNVPPALLPIASRDLIVIEAVRQFGKEGVRNPDLVAVAQEEWNIAWPQWCLVWKTQFRSGGALQTLTGRQLAELSQAVA